MSTSELVKKVRELKELRALADELAAEMLSLEDDIKETMTERGVEELCVDVYKIRWQTVESSRFDSAKFKKAMPELYSQYTKQTSSRRFSIA